MSKKAVKKEVPAWSLVQHLEDLGLRPVMPQMGIWEELSERWADRLAGNTGVEYFLHLLEGNGYGPAMAPVIATMYDWATTNNRDLYTFDGQVSSERNVRDAMLTYVADQVPKRGWFGALDDTLAVLAAHAPLPQSLCLVLDDQFNHPDQLHWSTKLAPLTGKMPRANDWNTMREELQEHYYVRDMDEFASQGTRGMHWLKNHRVDLVVASWLNGSSKPFSASLYSQLPNIGMEQPDNTTALFWLVALDYLEDRPDSVEASILSQWMEQYPDYKMFVQEHRNIVESLMGEDPLVCSGLMHTMWTERHEAGLETTLDGLLPGQ